jgi:hypothetical protein
MLAVIKESRAEIELRFGTCDLPVRGILRALLARQPSDAWSTLESDSVILAKPSRSALPGCWLAAR